MTFVSVVAVFLFSKRDHQGDVPTDTQPPKPLCALCPVSLCTDVTGTGTIPLHHSRRAVLVPWSPKADVSVVAIEHSCSLSTARL